MVSSDDDGVDNSDNMNIRPRKQERVPGIITMIDDDDVKLVHVCVCVNECRKNEKWISRD